VTQPDGMNQQMLKLHNKVRKEHDLPPLSLNLKLRKVAQQHAVDMKNQREIHHHPPIGKRLKDEGYQWANCAENAAKGGEVEKPEETFNNQWMKSDKGHKENILAPEMKEAGFGCASEASGQPYWCAVFAKQI
jgi:uncharacterized protein YkwD